MMKISRRFLEILFIPFLLFLMTNTVYSNAGSGLAFPGTILLLIGNIIIGLVEAFFVRKVFKIPVRYGIIILANYASMIFGYFVVAIAFPDNALTGYTPAFAAIMLPILFVASVLIEWPFFAGAVKDRPLGFTKTSFKYTFYAQCVSYVLLVPFYLLPMFDERPSAGSYVKYELFDLASNAYQYRIRYGFFGGGGGSYRGFSSDKGRSSDEYGRYGEVVSKDSIVFIAMNSDSTRRTASVVLDSTGKLHGWSYSKEAADTSFRGKVTSNLKWLSVLAYEYRMRPFLIRGRGGNYSGYSIPEKLSATEDGRYAATIISKDSIVFVAISTKDSNVTMSAVLDSEGYLHSWEFSVEPQGFHDLDPITDAFGLLADNARKYRGRPTSEAGGGGSFDGFSISKDLWILKYKRYTATVSRDSIVFVAMVKDSTRVIASVVLDSSGKLHSWKWRGKITY